MLVTGPSFEVALEVQRSALSARNALERTAVYSQRADTVQWLYAFRDVEAYKTELAERGWSLRIWWGWAKKECRIGVSYETDSDDGVEFKEAGGPLTDWEITARGLDSAHLRHAKESVERRRAAARERRREEAAREAAERAQKEAARLRRIADQRAAQEFLLKALKHTPEGLEDQWPSSWPMLKGSPRQVTWAESIRAQTIARLREELVEQWLPEARGVPVARWLALQSAAAFWINCRFLDTLEIVQMYEHNFGSPGRRRSGG